MSLKTLNEDIEELLNSIGATQQDINREKNKLLQEIKELERKRKILAGKNQDIGLHNKKNPNYRGSSEQEQVLKNKEEIKRIESLIKEKERDIQKLSGFKEPNQLSLFN